MQREYIQSLEKLSKMIQYPSPYYEPSVLVSIFQEHSCARPGQDFERVYITYLTQEMRNMLIVMILMTIIILIHLANIDGSSQ